MAATLTKPWVTSCILVNIIFRIVLHDNNHAKIKMGPEEKIGWWNAAITTKYLDHHNVYLDVAGLMLPLQKSGDDRVQIYFYNGWTSDSLCM